MRTLLVVYEVEGENAEEREKAVSAFLKSNEFWAKALKNAWFIRTSKELPFIRDGVRERIGATDKTFVIEVTKSGWATFNIVSIVTNWMKHNI